MHSLIVVLFSLAVGVGLTLFFTNKDKPVPQAVRPDPVPQTQVDTPTPKQ